MNKNWTITKIMKVVSSSLYVLVSFLTLIGSLFVVIASFELAEIDEIGFFCYLLAGVLSFLASLLVMALNATVLEKTLKNQESRWSSKYLNASRMLYSVAFLVQGILTVFIASGLNYGGESLLGMGLVLILFSIFPIVFLFLTKKKELEENLVLKIINTISFIIAIIMVISTLAHVVSLVGLIILIIGEVGILVVDILINAGVFKETPVAEIGQSENAALTDAQNLENATETTESSAIDDSENN